MILSRRVGTRRASTSDSESDNDDDDEDAWDVERVVHRKPSVAARPPDRDPSTLVDAVTALAAAQRVDGSWMALDPTLLATVASLTSLASSLGSKAPSTARATTELVVAWLEAQIAAPTVTSYLKLRMRPMVMLARTYLLADQT